MANAFGTLTIRRCYVDPESSTEVEAMLNSTASIAAFLSAFIPHSAAHGPVTPGTVRVGLHRHLGAEAGVHYEDAWLLAQLEHILATAPPVPCSNAAMWQDGLQAHRERRQGLKQAGAGCETAPTGGSGAGASGPTDAVAGSEAVSVLLDPAPDPSAEPPTDAGGSAAASTVQCSLGSNRQMSAGAPGAS